MLERLVDHLQTQSLGLGYAAVFGLLLAAGFGFPLPEDVALVAGGVLAWLASPLEQVTLHRDVHDHGLQAMVAVGHGRHPGRRLGHLLGRAEARPPGGRGLAVPDASSRPRSWNRWSSCSVGAATWW